MVLDVFFGSAVVSRWKSVGTQHLVQFLVCFGLMITSCALLVRCIEVDVVR